MKITPSLLQAALGCTAERAALWAPFVDEACQGYSINTPARLAAFLAQIGHESGALHHVREIWGPTPAQMRYEGRADLGNTQPGDGERYMGRGLIQTTGRHNYARVRDNLRSGFSGVPDFEAHPEALEQPRWAALSAGDYWADKGLNALADAGDFTTITRRINGGVNGLVDRLARWEKAKAVLAFTERDEEPIDTSAEPVDSPAPDVRMPNPPRPDQEPYKQPEARMPIPAIVAAVLPSIIEAIPRLGGLFGSGSKVAERNVKAAETVVEIVRSATGAVNAQDAAERLKSDPAAVVAATKAIEGAWFDLHQASEDSASAARQFATGYAQDHNVRTVLGNLTFLELLSLLLVICTLGGGLAAIIWGGIDAQLKGAIVTLMLIGGYTAVTQFWFGSSLGSKKKDDK